MSKCECGTQKCVSVNSTSLLPAKPSPWHPMTDVLDIKHIGKLQEETNELGAAAARCLIQGIDEAEPSTGKINRQWLQEEIADVLANIDLCIERFNLDEAAITKRKLRKKDFLRGWHNSD